MYYVTKTISGVQRKQTTNDWSREAVYMPECFDKCAQAYCSNSSKKKRFWKNNDFLTRTHAIFLTQSLVNIYGLAAAVCVYVWNCSRRDYSSVLRLARIECASRIEHSARVWRVLRAESPEATFPSCLVLSQPSAACLTWPLPNFERVCSRPCPHSFHVRLSCLCTSPLNLYVQLSHSAPFCLSLSLSFSLSHSHTQTHNQVRVFEWENPQAGSYPGFYAVWAQLS